jgi:L-histidine Nalpha-methyltransferase
MPSVDVRPIAATYDDALERLDAPGARRLVLFLGSSIGNLDPLDAGALLRRLRAALSPGDALLVGADLPKEPAILQRAYDDAAGVTAAFSKNVLVRLNRELGAGFEIERFRHLARWDPAASRMVMFLESMVDQLVPVEALGVSFQFVAGERIHTESSYKYPIPVTRALLGASGYRPLETYCDPASWFAVHLARVNP